MWNSGFLSSVTLQFRPMPAPPFGTLHEKLRNSVNGLIAGSHSFARHTFISPPVRLLYRCVTYFGDYLRVDPFSPVIKTFCVISSSLAFDEKTDIVDTLTKNNKRHAHYYHISPLIYPLELCLAGGKFCSCSSILSISAQEIIPSIGTVPPIMYIEKPKGALHDRII
jgi:hypothetical protein